MLAFYYSTFWFIGHTDFNEIEILWKFHAIHHSTEHLDWASGFRGHPLDGTILAPAFVFLVKVSPELTGAFAIAQLLLGLFLHANVSWRLKWLQKLELLQSFIIGIIPMREMRFGLITRHSYLFGTSSLALILCQKIADHKYME